MARRKWTIIILALIKMSNENIPTAKWCVPVCSSCYRKTYYFVNYNSSSVSHEFTCCYCKRKVSSKVALCDYRPMPLWLLMLPFTTVKNLFFVLVSIFTNSFNFIFGSKEQWKMAIEDFKSHKISISDKEGLLSLTDPEHTNSVYISVVRDFSKEPGSRYGRNSGHEFFKRKLKPGFLEAKEKKVKLVVNLDGAIGYSTGFLKEAFCNLGREFGIEEVISALEIVSTDEPALVEEINLYVQDSFKPPKETYGKHGFRI